MSKILKNKHLLVNGGGIEKKNEIEDTEESSGLTFSWSFISVLGLTYHCLSPFSLISMAFHWCNTGVTVAN